MNFANPEIHPSQRGKDPHAGIFHGPVTAESWLCMSKRLEKKCLNRMAELDFGAPFKKKDRMIKSLIKRPKNGLVSDRELHKRMTKLMQDYDLYYNI